MDKLKERAKERGSTKEKTAKYNEEAGDAYLDIEEQDFTELEISTPEAFFTKDVIMKLYDEKGDLVQTSFFDKETIAMRTESQVTVNPVFHDRKGKFYAFNEEKNQYESISLLPPSSMGFMMAGMIPQFYNLPQSPYIMAFEALSKFDVTVSFYVLELAFIYKPEHFENDRNSYTKSSVACGSNKCIKFAFNSSEYKGSYIQFDSKNNLREFYIKTTKQQSSARTKNQTGKFVFNYKPVIVELPDAVEQSLVPGPLGKILPLEKGLEPWKHNKKDKKD